MQEVSVRWSAMMVECEIVTSVLDKLRDLVLGCSRRDAAVSARFLIGNLEDNGA